MTVKDVITIVLLLAGCFFFLTGTLGVLRFPNLFARIHALTNADNLGMGFIALGMALHIASPLAAIKIFLIWLFTIISSSTSSYLIGRFQREQNQASNEDE